MKKETFKYFYKGMKDFGSTITILMNSILLCIVYFFGVGIVAIIARLAKKKFLELRMNKESYWTILNLKKKELKEYYRQF